jgi:hypothetical protein
MVLKEGRRPPPRCILIYQDHKMKQDITQEQLIRLFEYNPKTGVFTNRVRRGARALVGSRAGTPSFDGYRQIIVCGTVYFEHRLAWLYMTGLWPAEEIDHIDGDRTNNLRLANRHQNSRNSSRPVGMSGLRGAYLDPRTMKWYSRVRVGCKQKKLGPFGTAEEAAFAYRQAAELHYGEFAFHKRTMHSETT